MNGKMSTSNNSSISALTSPYVTSTNGEVCSLKSPIHNNIKYPEFSKGQVLSIRRASDVMNTRIKLLAHKTWNFVILEYSLKY